jgi:hypothetical protein
MILAIVTPVFPRQLPPHSEGTVLEFGPGLVSAETKRWTERLWLSLDSDSGWEPSGNWLHRGEQPRKEAEKTVTLQAERRPNFRPKCRPS